jgi:predicted RND superfamily exporter protein
VSMTQRILKFVEPCVFTYRWITLAVLGLITAFFAFQATQLQPQAGWLKMVPQEHPYMETFLEYYDDFGGANTVIVALKNQDGTIYEPEFMERLRQVTDEVFFVPGVDRARVMSIFTPNVMYVEVIEGGLAGANVIPDGYEPTEEMMRRIRSNVGKANVIGRLVSEDETAALVVAELMDFDPHTGKPLDYSAVGTQLEEIRAAFEDDAIAVHIIGFAKIVDDITAASFEVATFFAISLVLTGLLLWGYVGSWRLAMMPMICSVAAVLWGLGFLRTIGFGLDPFAILVPFLILAVSVSHGVQYVNAWAGEVMRGANSYQASLATFRRLAIPGTVALITDVVGFATIYLINIAVIREMSVNAAFGIFAIIATNKLMMPALLTFMRVGNLERFKAAQQKRDEIGNRIWRQFAKVTRRGPAIGMLVVYVLLLGWALTMLPKLTIGDTGEGVPELRPDSRFNIDARQISSDFALGTNIFTVIAETGPDGCINYDIMHEVNRFSWYLRNTDGIREVMSLLDYAKLAYAGLNEGRLNAEALPRDHYSLAQSTALVPTTTGLLNNDCSALALMAFTHDHRAETLIHIVDAVKTYEAEIKVEDGVNFRLASGNVGVMAATNEVVKAQEFTVVMWVFVVIIIFLWLSFRTLSGVLCVVLPLSLVTLMAYGVMVLLGIGQKVATLPVIALATGIGVDYGIYMYSILAAGLRQGLDIEEATYETLRKTGKAIIFTGLALGASVVTWLMSALQFQADMGILLMFMFTANMFGAIFILPALARFLGGEERRHKGRDLSAGADDALH